MSPVLSLPPIAARTGKQLDQRQVGQLARRWRDHQDRRAFDRLVEAHLRLAAKIASEYYCSPADRADLLQEASLGLIEAVRHFDPERNVKLSTYASFWVRAFVLRFLVRNTRLVRVGTTHSQRRVMFHLARERERMMHERGAIDEGVLARRLGVEEGELSSLAAHLAAPEASLDAEADHGEPSPALGVSRPDEEVEEHDERAQIRAQVEQLLEELGERDREVMTARWMNDDPPTLSDLGRRFGVSRERVRQIEERLLERLGGRLRRALGAR